MGLCSSCIKGSSSDYTTPDMIDSKYMRRFTRTRNFNKKSYCITKREVIRLIRMTKCLETRRRQQVEAAERRQQEQENRGIKDPERVKRMQKRSEELSELEQKAARSNQDTGGLKWQVS